MRTKAKGEAADGAGSQGPPEEEDVVGLPPGMGFAPDSEEEPERLEDLEAEGPEGSEEEEEPEELTPREQALQKQLDDAQAQIGRLGDELGPLRQRVQAQPEAYGQPGITPVQGQPQADPFEEAKLTAGREFLQTGDVEKWVRTTNRIENAKFAAAGQYFREQIVSETRAESDFFAKNSDLLEGTPRSIFEGELAKAKLLNPRTPVPEQRRQAAEQTRELLKQIGGQLVDEDEAARREAGKLRGAPGRRSRTGAPAGPASGQSVAAGLTQQYIRDSQEAQRRSQSRA